MAHWALESGSGTASMQLKTLMIAHKR